MLKKAFISFFLFVMILGHIIAQNQTVENSQKLIYGVKTNNFGWIGNNTSLFVGNEKFSVQGGIAFHKHLFYYQKKAEYGFNIGMRFVIKRFKNGVSLNTNIIESHIENFKQRKTGSYQSYDALDLNPTIAFTFPKEILTVEIGPSLMMGRYKMAYNPSYIVVVQDRFIEVLAHLSINLAPLFAKNKNK